MKREFTGYVEAKMLEIVAGEIEAKRLGGWGLPIYAEKQPHMAMVRVTVTADKKTW